ncbi:immunity protein YezG family protein [Paenibacillus wulumuqiensis]|uniref:immunity protein YezG family protein n=1 Tax=Paenibacillus wulumuqiensis TaxID=1567107 RepID=UPI0006984E87|nr:immunity protein YezG family protein [Paenibacillus wulumuqiensis]
MMNVENIYQKLASAINDIIPTEWEKVYFYGEVLDDSSEVYFYFNTLEAPQNYIYVYEIPNLYHVEEEVVDREVFALHAICEELREVFRESNQELWTNFTMIIDHTGHFKVDYDYTDLINIEMTDFKRQLIWEYDHLGMVPTHPGDQAFLKEYLEKRESQN